MNKPEKIEEIRRAVIAVNPEIEDYCSLSKRVDGKRHSHVFDGDDPYTICHYCGERRSAPSGMLITSGNGELRPIRLADVLLAIWKVTPANKTNITVECDGQFIQRTNGENPFTKETWNLRRDSLEDQEEPTINFIHELIQK